MAGYVNTMVFPSVRKTAKGLPLPHSNSFLSYYLHTFFFIPCFPLFPFLMESPCRSFGQRHTRSAGYSFQER